MPTHKSSDYNSKTKCKLVKYLVVLKGVYLGFR